MENEKRKQIETALGQFFLRYRYAFLVKVWDRIITHLAEEVIVVQLEAKHHDFLPGAGQPWEVLKTIDHGDRRGMKHYIDYRGKKKFTGKALAIILSLES